MQARDRGLTSTITFLTGNLAPQRAIIKSTAIDPSVVDTDGVYRKTGPARVFTSERAAIAAVKSLSENPVAIQGEYSHDPRTRSRVRLEISSDPACRIATICDTFKP